MSTRPRLRQFFCDFGRPIPGKHSGASCTKNSNTGSARKSRDPSPDMRKLQLESGTPLGPTEVGNKTFRGPRLGLVRQSAEGLPVAVDDLPRFLVSDATAGSAVALSD